MNDQQQLDAARDALALLVCMLTDDGEAFRSIMASYDGPGNQEARAALFVAALAHAASAVRAASGYAGVDPMKLLAAVGVSLAAE
jgi:formiminotetrahydrofolate cyclodeaminase